MKIYTNHHWRQIKYRNEVPTKILENEFGWLPDELDGFFRYRGRWYHLQEMLHISDNAPFPKKWDGYASDSFFSGILIKVSSDCEEYQIATYISGKADWL